MPAVPLLLGLIRLRKLSSAQRWMMGMLVMMLVMQVIGGIVGRKYLNSYPVFHVYVWLEFFFIAMVYRKELFRLWSPLKTGISVLIACFLCLGIADMALINGPLKSPNYARPIEMILVLLFGFSYFALTYREMKIFFLECHFLFWFTAGTFFFFSFNILTYFLDNFLYENFPRVQSFFYPFHSITVVVLNCFYMVAITRKDPAHEGLEELLPSRTSLV